MKDNLNKELVNIEKLIIENILARRPVSGLVPHILVRQIQLKRDYKPYRSITHE